MKSTQTSQKVMKKVKVRYISWRSSWNRILHGYLTENDYTQNPADNSVYVKETKCGKVIMIIWVDG